MNPEIVGSLAAILTTTSYIPQLAKVLRHRDTQSISLGMYVILTIGIATWFIYGAMINSPSIMLANGTTLVMTIAILITKLKHG